MAGGEWDESVATGAISFGLARVEVEGKNSHKARSKLLRSLRHRFKAQKKTVWLLRPEASREYPNKISQQKWSRLRPGGYELHVTNISVPQKSFYYFKGL